MVSNDNQAGIAIMKVKVNRELLAGVYHVNFEVSSFTVDEVTKMQKFGVPTINMKWSSPQGPKTGPIPINSITSRYDAVFSLEKQATDYQGDVLSQIKTAIEQLRLKKDEYSLSTEVDF